MMHKVDSEFWYLLNYMNDARVNFPEYARQIDDFVFKIHKEHCEGCDDLNCVPCQATAPEVFHLAMNEVFGTHDLKPLEQVKGEDVPPDLDQRFRHFMMFVRYLQSVLPSLNDDLVNLFNTILHAQFEGCQEPDCVECGQLSLQTKTVVVGTPLNTAQQVKPVKDNTDDVLSHDIITTD